MDGFKPDRYDYLGATICLVGVAVIMFAPRRLVALEVRRPPAVGLLHFFYTYQAPLTHPWVVGSAIRGAPRLFLRFRAVSTASERREERGAEREGWQRVLGSAWTVIEVVVLMRAPGWWWRRCGLGRGPGVGVAGVGRRAPWFDRGEGRRRWRALDLGTMTVWLEADAPRDAPMDRQVGVGGFSSGR